MNKTALKNFAINARLELLRRVADRANAYGIDEEKCKKQALKPSGEFQKADGSLLTTEEAAQRSALISRIRSIGYKQVMEEAAYTWFNRFIAIRYMQEHNHLPISLLALPDAPGALPQMVREAQNIDLPGADLEKVLAMLDSNRTDELFKYLLIALCNALHEPLPRMFEEISDYTELLFPDHLLRADSVLGELSKLGAEYWNEIEVIGWLYQYYNTQLKDETFELLKKNVKITKERIGAATQLFTPEWIVRYMVENSLGRLWQEGHHDETLRMKWRYYMDEAQQEPEVAAKLTEIRRVYADMQPEQITLLDPCMGSGHILAYAFDLLMDIYRSVGYTDRDAVQSIVENNLYGLDIDDRAAQLAYFAVMMKACEYDRRFLRRGVQPHVLSIQESGEIETQKLNCLGAEKRIALQLIASFADAKEYGSILHIDLTEAELSRLAARLESLKSDGSGSFIDMADSREAAAVLEPLIAQARILVRQYDAVITNPPYMGASGMNDKLSRFVKESYPDSKSDLFAVFIERCGELLNRTGYQAMITQHAWMFLSSYEKLRGKLQARELINMAHLGPRAFEEIGGEVVQTTAFVMQKKHEKDYKGHYARLIEPTTQDGKKEMFLAETNRYFAQQENFTKIPGMPIVYWVRADFIALFGKKKIDDIAEAKSGMTTTDNNRFLRLWSEVSLSHIGFDYQDILNTIDRKFKWYPFAKGGEFRRWYGNHEYVVNWFNNGEEIRKEAEGATGGRLVNIDVALQRCLTWTKISSSSISLRMKAEGIFFSDAAPGLFCEECNEAYLLALMNSKCATYCLNLINPTLNYVPGAIASIPIVDLNTKREDIDRLSWVNCEISEEDWDSFETSWNFKKHPLI